MTAANIDISAQGAAGNPFSAEWTTQFGAPPFSSIEPEHFRPAIDAGIREQQAEIDMIAGDPAEPSFQNTTEALERSGRGLRSHLSHRGQRGGGRHAP